MMIEGFERGIYIYHSSMTAPFGDLALHLQDCCGGCPYCIECCQKAVDEANEIMIARTKTNPLAPRHPLGEDSDTAYVATGCGHYGGMVKVQGDKEAVAAHINFVKAHADHLPWDCIKEKYDIPYAAVAPTLRATLPRDMGVSNGIVSSGGGWFRDIAGRVASYFFG